MAARPCSHAPNTPNGWAHQVSESPASPRSASLASPGVNAALSQRPGGGLSPRTWSRSFRATADQIREARHFLAGILRDSPVAGDALVCLSELATNSVRHSNSRRPGGYFAVHASLYPAVLRVGVEDEGGPWMYRHDRDDQRGRGLVIVGALSSDWFIVGDGTGARTVWFEISHVPRPAPSPDPANAR